MLAHGTQMLMNGKESSPGTRIYNRLHVCAVAAELADEELRTQLLGEIRKDAHHGFGSFEQGRTSVRGGCDRHLQFAR